MYLFTLSQFGDQKLLQRTLDFAISPDVRSQDALQVITGVMGNPAGEKLAWDFVRQHWTEVEKAGGPFAGFFSDGHAPAPAVIVALRVSNFLQEILHLLACSAHTWQTILSLHSLSTQSDAAPHDKEFS